MVCMKPQKMKYTKNKIPQLETPFPFAENVQISRK